MDFNSSNLIGNKSFSAPDISNTGPLFRRVIIEEQYFPHNLKSVQCLMSQTCKPEYSTLESSSIGSTYPSRTYSCDQLPLIKPDALDDTFNLPVTSTSTPLRDVIMPPDSPMDVDLTAESLNTTIKIEPKTSNTPKRNILDYVDLTFQGGTAVMKKKLTKSKKSKSTSKQKRFLSSETNNHTTSLKHIFSKLNIALFLVIVVSIPIYDRLNYIRELDLEAFDSDLKSSIIGQNRAISQLTQALENFKNSSSKHEIHLMSLIGTAGVGKTLSVNIIKRKFMPKQIIDIDIESLDESAYADSLNLYKTVPYLLILDNIRYKNIQKVIHILNSLPKEKWILVVIVFNIQDTEDARTFHVNNELYHKIPHELSELDFKLHTVRFEQFHANFIERHIDGFSQIYSNILRTIPKWKTFLAQHDFDTLGFKGLFEKMNAYAQ